MIKGFTFEGQLSDADVDALIYNKMLNGNDGVLQGLDMTSTADTITIDKGLCVIAGRPIAVVGSEDISVSATSETNYCVLVLEIDKTKESSTSAFEQVSFKVLSSTVSYTTTTQQDINYDGDGTIYQYEFARFKLGLTGITDFTDKRKYINLDNIFTTAKAETEELIEQIEQELANVEDGSLYVLKEDGKSLSSNDYTSTEKSKLEGIEESANKTVIENVLTSSSTTKALSSAQGKALKSLIDSLTTTVSGKQKTISKGTSTPSGGSSGDIYIQYFS